MTPLPFTGRCTEMLKPNRGVCVALGTGTALVRLRNAKMALNWVVLSVLLLGLSGQAHAASEWETFTSKYSGCSVQYPTYIFSPGREIDADGATSFTSGLAEAGMVVAGGSNDKSASVAEIVRIYLKQVEGRASLTAGRSRDGLSIPVIEAG